MNILRRDYPEILYLCTIELTPAILKKYRDKQANEEKRARKGKNAPQKLASLAKKRREVRRLLDEFKVELMELDKKNKEMILD